MNWMMFRRALIDLRWTVFWYAIGIVVYIGMVLTFFPSVRAQAELFDQYLEMFPEAVLRAFGVTGDITSYAGFLGSQVLNLIWPIIVSVFLIMAGTATIAQEVERGTVELWLSVPERRWRLLMSKAAALLVGLLLVVGGTVLTVGLGAWLLDEALALGQLLALGLVLAAFGVAVLGYSLLFSSFASERGKAAGLAAVVTLAFYLLWVIGGLSETWDWLRYLSIFTAFTPQKALGDGDLSVGGLLALLAIGAIGATVAALQFERRDAIS